MFLLAVEGCLQTRWLNYQCVQLTATYLLNRWVTCLAFPGSSWPEYSPAPCPPCPAASTLWPPSPSKTSSWSFTRRTCPMRRPQRSQRFWLLDMVNVQLLAKTTVLIGHSKLFYNIKRKKLPLKKLSLCCWKRDLNQRSHHFFLRLIHISAFSAWVCSRQLHFCREIENFLSLCWRSPQWKPQTAESSVNQPLALNDCVPAY